MPATYLLDGNEILFTDLIRIAKNEGYDEPSGLYCTSGAACYLRRYGHIVEENTTIKTEENYNAG